MIKSWRMVISLAHVENMFGQMYLFVNHMSNKCLISYNSFTSSYYASTCLDIINTPTSSNLQSMNDAPGESDFTAPWHTWHLWWKKPGIFSCVTRMLLNKNQWLLAFWRSAPLVSKYNTYNLRLQPILWSMQSSLTVDASSQQSFKHMRDV